MKRHQPCGIGNVRTTASLELPEAVDEDRVVTHRVVGVGFVIAITGGVGEVLSVAEDVEAIVRPEGMAVGSTGSRAEDHSQTFPIRSWIRRRSGHRHHPAGPGKSPDGMLDGRSIRRVSPERQTAFDPRSRQQTIEVTAPRFPVGEKASVARQVGELPVSPKVTASIVTLTVRSVTPGRVLEPDRRLQSEELTGPPNPRVGCDVVFREDAVQI